MRWVVVLALALGCGDSTGTGGSSGSGGTGGTGGSGGTGGMSGSGGSGGSGGTGGMSGSGGSGGMMPDASFGPPGELTCGLNGTTMTCSPGQLCCAVFVPTTQIHCRTGSCMNGESTFACDGPEDCSGGQVCCMDFNAILAFCAASCNTSQNQQEVCHTGATCPTQAPHCCTSNGSPSGICVATPPQGATCN